MLVVRPRLHELVSPEESRTLRQLDALGVESGESPGRSTASVTLAPGASPSQRLLGWACVDYLLRLDPLVSEVHLEGFPAGRLQELKELLPLGVADDGTAPADFRVSVGDTQTDSDLVVDAVGWIASLGGLLEPTPQRILNPIGPLAAAALATGETFKALFALNHPDAPLSRRFVSASGAFSFFDYSFDGANPSLDPILVDAHLVGLGGVGAAIVRALGELGDHISGRLVLIDPDQLATDNLNRVLYARWQAAIDEVPKVQEAKRYLRARSPLLELEPHQASFTSYKRALARHRADRRYDVVVTGLDTDDARHEVQRDLPRVLIDGATGRDTNLTVERSIVGQWGCLGCTRQMAPPADGIECDDPPDTRAPSLSFVSGLAGTLAAGELLKQATDPNTALRGAFDHVFIYSPNPYLLMHEPAFSDSCRIDCAKETTQQAYRMKYG